MSDLELRVCARYKLYNKIGGGQYGQIYMARNAQNNLPSAIKMEQIKTKHPQVLYEGKIMQNLQGGTGIPSMYWCGQEGDYNFLVMELLDQTLAQLQEKCGGKFSLRTVLLIIDKIMKNVEYVHFKTYVHRDFKPENFMIGRGKRANNFFTIDFGLSKKYIDPSSHKHIPWKDRKPLIGTARYASISAHKGCELSRRDDLESLAYMFVYMLQGTLPWQGIQARTKDEKHIKVKQMKMNMAEEDICDGCPKQFAQFLKYAKSLKFEERPSYEYITNLFRELAEEHNYLYDEVFDWYLIEKQAEVIPKQPLNNYTEYLPFKKEMFEGEEEFIKSLNLEQYEHCEELSTESLKGLKPLTDIKMTQEEKQQQTLSQDKLDKGWKKQQQQCYKILKEQQFLLNERDMNLKEKISTNSQFACQSSRMVIDNGPNNVRSQEFSNGVQIPTQSIASQQMIKNQEDMSVTQRDNSRPQYLINAEKQLKEQQKLKSNHSKKKSNCNIQ